MFMFIIRRSATEIFIGLSFFLLSAGTGAQGQGPAGSRAQTQATIYPGEIWPDDRGRHIQAHGGGIIKLDSLYYWYGEERSAGLDTGYRYVSCYSSADLVNWTFRGDVVKMSNPDHLEGRWILERPK